MIFHLCAVRQKRVLISARLAAAHMYPANIHASQHQKQIFGTCANRLSAVCIMYYWTTFSINKHTHLRNAACVTPLSIGLPSLLKIFVAWERNRNSHWMTSARTASRSRSLHLRSWPCPTAFQVFVQFNEKNRQVLLSTLWWGKRDVSEFKNGSQPAIGAEKTFS